MSTATESLVLPSDSSVEKYLVGTLLNNGFLARAAVQRLEPTSFEDEFCEELYRIISKLYRAGSEIDQNTVMYASEIPLDEADYADILSYNSPDKLDGYIRAVAEKSAGKRLELIFGGLGNDSVPDFISKKITLLNDIRESVINDQGALKNSEDMAALFIKALKDSSSNDPKHRILTGIPELDQMISGIEPHWVVVIGARPSMGKTTLALNIVEHVCLREGKRSMVVSLEMPAEELGKKFISSIGRISYHNIRNGTLSRLEKPRIQGVLDEFRSMDILVDDKGNQTWEEIELKIRREHHKSPLSLVVIDYLQLIEDPDPKRSEVDKIAHISRKSKQLAKDIKVPIILLAQLNRDLEKRAEKRPVMSDLRGSGQIEQDADLIIFPYREYIYTNDPKVAEVCELICGKFRHGQGQDLILKFEGKYSKFSGCGGQPHKNPGSHHNGLSRATLAEAGI